MSGMVPLAPQSDTRSFHGDARSFYGGDTRSFYGNDNRSGSFYNQPMVENRGSSYSLIGAQTQTPGFDRASSYGFNPDAGRASSYSYAAPAPPSRPPSNFLGDLNVETAPIALGAEGITDAQLEGSVRRICAGADLDTLTKKGVRKQLEEEYGVGLTSRKDAINRIIEKVLAGESELRPGGILRLTRQNELDDHGRFIANASHISHRRRHYGLFLSSPQSARQLEHLKLNMKDIYVPSLMSCITIYATCSAMLIGHHDQH